MVDDVVVGAGIGGLALAWRLRSRGRSVVVLDAADRAGGVVRTVHRDGLRLEQGAQTVQTTVEVSRLIDELGLMDRVIAPSAAASTRFVLHRGRLVPLPHGPGDVLGSPLLGPRAALRIAVEPLVPRRRQGPETVAGFVGRRFGRRVLPLVDAFLGGVFAGDPTQVEMDSAFPDLVGWERDAGSVLVGGVRAMRVARARPRPPVPKPFFSLEGGVQTLVDTLAERLGADLRLSTPATALRRDAAAWRVETPAGDLAARRVWLACPLPVSARLLDAPELTVPRAPLAAVHLAWDEARVPGPLGGFGWLAPSAERRDVLGCLWVTDVFPGHAPGRTMVRLMLGGARAPELAALSDDALVDHARGVLREVQGIEAAPDLVDVAVHREGIPQYPLGHAAAVDAWQRRWPDLRLLGWATTGIGVSHAVRTAERLTD